MDKQEAIQALQEGATMTHKLFSPEETVRCQGSGLVFEDGMTCSLEYFFSNRTSPAWNEGWSVTN